MDLTKKEHGFDGSFYEGKKHPDKVIIYVGDHGMAVEELIAGGTYLLGAGYCVLFLEIGGGYPIALDDGERAVQWIKNYFSERPVKIAMTGLYLGAQYALLCAAQFPDISCVAACSPYDHVMEAFDRKSIRFGKSFFGYRDKTFPYSPWFILEEGMLRLTLKSLRDKRYGPGRFGRYLYDRNLTVPQSRIPVENMHADVLFLASDNDDVLPAETAAERMKKVLEDAGYRYRVRIKIYENGSHVLGCPLEGKRMKKKLPAVMKRPKEAREAAQDSMTQIIHFFNMW